MSALADVAASLDPLLAGHARRDPPPGRFGEGARAYVLEAVHEGYLLHYGESRLFPDADADLALLAGDTLYALGLARLAEAGDVAAVAELADLISICAAAEADGRRDVADAAWRATEALLLRGEGPGARAVAGGLGSAADPR